LPGLTAGLKTNAYPPKRPVDHIRVMQYLRSISLHPLPGRYPCLICCIAMLSLQVIARWKLNVDGYSK